MVDENQHIELHILKEIAELLNEGTEVETLLPEVLKRLLEITGLQIGWIFLIDEQGNHHLAAKENLPPALSFHEFAPMESGNCWCVDRFNSGDLTKATNIIECRRIKRALAEKRNETNGLTHHATVPLGVGSERFGLLNIGSPQKKEFTEDELSLLESVALQIGTSLKRISLTQKERETALVAERNRLAHDLHDSVKQLLFSLNLTARGGIELTDEKDVKDTFSYIQQLAQQAFYEMNVLIWQLRPQGLEKGLISALQNYGDMVGLKTKIEASETIKLPAQLEEAIWRIGQEALANCKKHSGQSRIEIKLQADFNIIKIFFIDHGKGFFYDSQKELPSLGLKSMKERTEALNGIFQLQSSPEQGTKIVLEFPLQGGGS
ncbi:GAF domain-containing sensor histidine kinase [Bacillaceae bacterium Marseille-Q3522]|nr:GAF domain-containing sensor histidine kinase [Bacillaceae bacterium Marseille-Q3522]